MPNKKKFDKTKWDMIFGKLKKLGTAIEMYYGEKMNIDNFDYRWVNDRIEYYEGEERLFNKAKSITRQTSNNHPDHVITNIIIRSQIDEDFKSN